MMNDMRHISGRSGRKVASNRMKVKKEPIDLRKYLLPLIRYGSVGGLVIVVAGMIYASAKGLMKATPFPVQKIEVRGVKRITEQEVLGGAGIDVGQNLLGIKLKSVCQQIASNPWVSSVRVQRFFPGTVSVNIVEREPLAVANMGLLYYVDVKGEPFKPLNFGDTLNLPVVTGFSEEDLSEDPAGTRENLKNAIELLAALKSHGSFLLADVSEIHYDKSHGFTVYTMSSALPIKVGIGDYTGKLARLAQIYQTLISQHPALQYIDLDYSDRIVVKKS